MDDRIRVLPDRVANLIAAGEVVQNPSSVIKEMVENSVDAGATEIVVNYRNGGSELIQIVDNGIGMTPNDARMSFEKHATSKIKDPEDLYALHTFGFRGEALASIAAVAQVELRTRCEGYNIGTVTTVNGGRFADQQPTMCEIGTNIFVRNLFYNIPARKKFIDSSKRGASLIKSEFKRVALCNPEISFELYGDNTLIYKLPATNEVGRIVDIAGKAIKRNLLEAEASTTIVRVHGYIGRPECARRGTTDQYLFINGRYFKSSYIHSAITKAYEKIISPQLNISYFLFIETDPDRIDVNVHPQKIEIKFQDRDEVWMIVNAAAREALAKSGSVPMMDFDTEESIEIPVMQQGSHYSEPKAVYDNSYNPFAKESKVSSWSMGVGSEEFGAAGEEWSDIEMGSTLEFESEEEHIIQGELSISQDNIPSNLLVNRGYAWFNTSGGVMVVDLRRAHEMMLYESYMEQLTTNQVVSQGVLFPIELQLSESEYSQICEEIELFSAMGFDIDLASDHYIYIRSLPANISNESVDTLIYKLIHLFDTPMDMEEYRRGQMAELLARAAIGDQRREYSEPEARDILTRVMQRGEIPRTPSGKSIAVEISNEEIKSRLN
ncbi:MAG: DNA mismatch repair endonuclease MutL [Rikenellaceae bacterium]